MLTVGGGEGYKTPQRCPPLVVRILQDAAIPSNRWFTGSASRGCGDCPRNDSHSRSMNSCAVSRDAHHLFPRVLRPLGGGVDLGLRDPAIAGRAADRDVFLQLGVLAQVQRCLDVLRAAPDQTPSETPRAGLQGGLTFWVTKLSRRGIWELAASARKRPSR